MTEIAKNILIINTGDDYIPHYYILSRVLLISMLSNVVRSFIGIIYVLFIFNYK